MMKPMVRKVLSDRPAVREWSCDRSLSESCARCPCYVFRIIKILKNYSEKIRYSSSSIFLGHCLAKRDGHFSLASV